MGKILQNDRDLEQKQILAVQTYLKLFALNSFDQALRYPIHHCQRSIIYLGCQQRVGPVRSVLNAPSGVIATVVVLWFYRLV